MSPFIYIYQTLKVCHFLLHVSLIFIQLKEFVEKNHFFCLSVRQIGFGEKDHGDSIRPLFFSLINPLLHPLGD